MRPPAEIGISQKSRGVFAFPAAFLTRGLKEHCCHNFCFDPCTCANVTSVDSANRHLSHYIQYMQPQSSLLQLAATAVLAHAYRQSLQSGHDAARVYESCLFDACGEYAALFVSTASGFKGAGCPKIQESVFFPACTV